MVTYLNVWFYLKVMFWKNIKQVRCVPYHKETERLNAKIIFVPALWVWMDVRHIAVLKDFCVLNILAVPLRVFYPWLFFLGPLRRRNHTENLFSQIKNGKKKKK